jgi:SLOG cluster2/ATPase family associated with various cellular activities (AAA)
MTSERDKALKIVDCNYRKETLPKIKGLDSFGKLFLFSDGEKAQLDAMRELIEQYGAQREPLRPLSLAVFGPPGSGKSVGVTQILNKLNLSLVKINLTQASDSSSVSRVLDHATKLPPDTLPVIFFDEFDAPRDGAPFGWLSWFLAPMQDGEFVDNGAVVKLRRAVFVFAGGTATTMREFSGFIRRPEFQQAKGPDFISRLRGFLDVSGPNAEPSRLLRRAVLFRMALDREVAKGSGKFRADGDLIKSLLQVGRYRHGARSIDAVVELSHLEKKKHFEWRHLPDDHLLALHIDRGPLDLELIDGTVALSGYSEDKKVKDWWDKIARRLWDEGATISYAGRLAAGTLMSFLEQELRKRPPEPSKRADRRGKPRPWLKGFLDKSERASVDKVISKNDRIRMGLDVTFAPHLTKEERNGLAPWLGKSVERFRRRLAVTDTSVARFVISGAISGHEGRFPGIAEEVMLSLAQGHPIYVAGALPGAARDVGLLLGLSHPRRGQVPPSFEADPKSEERNLHKVAKELRPPPWTDLPITATECAEFLKRHALGGPKWPCNGLTFDENRELFKCNNPDKAADLVVRGLLRRFGEAAPWRLKAGAKYNRPGDHDHR